jgi:hypothetical protein
MNALKEILFKKWPLASVLSPAGLVLTALFILLAFGICEAIGLREYTTVISGTVAVPGASFKTSFFLALIYLATYFAFVLLLPILVIAAALLVVWKKYQGANSY